MKRLSYFILAVSLLIFLISLIALFFSTRALETKKFYADVNVTSEAVMGFDVNTTALTFGKISKELGSSKRNVIFDNSYSFPVLIETKVKGDISQLLSFDSFIMVEEGEKKIIPLYAAAPSNISDGFYSGTVEFIIKPAT